ncbi:hypothetical protein EDC14_100986 [Hydrogenispora ethanolica]|uniref:Uncharacterized protein n=1 Tax=Hydrogenispora ethanolica TaxID=1082276 RepID=A0A4R1RWB9_HYDET|nr:hypothetical protein [Hydrogenispora ethanolica]TCL70769.1 hypothetical protein EDC14_100986 [Hydrogenispora ethanolica]
MMEEMFVKWVLVAGLSLWVVIRIGLANRMANSVAPKSDCKEASSSNSPRVA